MSQIVNAAIQVTDLKTAEAACRAVGAVWLGWGRHTVFSDQYKGFGIQLKGWNYPVVIVSSYEDRIAIDETDSASIRRTDSGEIVRLGFDNYDGVWGSDAALDGFLREYSVQRLSGQMQEAAGLTGQVIQTYDSEANEMVLELVQAGD